MSSTRERRTQSLRVSLVQPDVVWHSIEDNLRSLSRILGSISDTDLIILPEMFTTGFTMEPGLVADGDGMTASWMREQAARHDVAVAGSAAISDGGRYFNRFFWVEPSGETRTYDKRHLFRMAGEHDHYQRGTRRLVVDWRGWRVCPLICYDLRFPVWSRNGYDEQEARFEFDLLVYVANWPASRVHVWDTLLAARAAENLCYSAGVNRIGTDGNGVAYNGHSSLFSPTGVCVAGVEHSKVTSYVLDRLELDNLRSSFPAHLDADRFEVVL